MKKLLFILIFCINLFGEQRIVTLSPSINEIVFALGLGENIVANTKYCDFPEESKNVQKIGGYNDISLEKILDVKPTIVIGQDYDEKLIQNLKSLNIKILSYKTNTIEDIKNTILELGILFRKEQRAKQIISKIDNSLASLKSIVENKKILIVISPKNSLSNQIYVTGNFLYFEDITIVIITHDLETIKTVLDRFIILKQKIIFDGNITEALNSNDEFIKDFLTNKGK